MKPSVSNARVFSFSVRKIAAVRFNFSLRTSHFVPNSYVLTSSGFKLLMARDCSSVVFRPGTLIPSEPSPASTPTGFADVA